jgi:hypothetical protein
MSKAILYEWKLKYWDWDYNVFFAANLQGDDHLGVIQVLLTKCQESEELCNEFYLQLMKQTTDHPGM